MPGLRTWVPKYPSRQRAVILARIADKIHRNSGLAQRPIHLKALPQRISGIAVALQEEEWRLRMSNAGKRTLLPRVGVMLPWFPIEPAVVPRAAFGAVFAVLVDHRSAADDGFE